MKSYRGVPNDIASPEHHLGFYPLTNTYTYVTMTNIIIVFLVIRFYSEHW